MTSTYSPGENGHPQLTDAGLVAAKRRGRVLVLLDAAERASVAPLPTERLHAFAYLADVLSPVWGLAAFDRVVLKEIGGPFYPGLQREMDGLVAAGLLHVSDLTYVDRPREGARIHGSYSLAFGSPHLPAILDALGCGSPELALDPRDVRIHTFLIELAGALARLPNDEIDRAATIDVTYADRRIHENNLVYLDRTGEFRRPNLSVAAAERFVDFFPPESTLSPGEKIYLYANLLGRRVKAG